MLPSDEAMNLESRGGQQDKFSGVMASQLRTPEFYHEITKQRSGSMDVSKVKYIKRKPERGRFKHVVMQMV